VDLLVDAPDVDGGDDEDDGGEFFRRLDEYDRGRDGDAGAVPGNPS
jgi:hypothetical protein